MPLDPGVVTSGPAHLVRALGLWRRRPGLMALGVVPALIVLAVLGVLLVLLLLHVSDLVAWATPFLGEGTLGELVRVLVALLVVGAFLAGSVVLFVALTLLVGEPFYQRIWREAELMAGGPVPTGEVPWTVSLRDTGVLLARGVAGAAALFLLGLVPVVGTAAAAAGGVLVTGWLLASELLARPLEARGMDAAARRALQGRARTTVLGFGISVQVCFLVPLGAVVVMPAAVVGATTLARQLLATQPADAPTGSTISPPSHPLSGPGTGPATH